MKKSRKPKIRFKGFTDDWEQRKVTELGMIYIGLVTTMTSHYTNDGILLIRNSDIKDGRFEFGDNQIFLERSFAKANESRMHQLGDVITVHTGDVGTSAVITKNEVKSIGFATIVTRPNRAIINPYYLCTFLNTEKHKKWAVAISTGDGRTNYNLGDYLELIIPVPSINEQKEIALFIEKINTLITLHQRKLEKLMNVKKSMLEKMFPKQGSKVPEIRFNGFTQAWEQRKLGDLGSLKNGMNFSKDAMGHGSAFVNLQNIFGNNVVDARSLGLAEASEKQLLDYSLQKGDVLFVRSSVKLEGVGETALVAENLENTTYSGFIIRFRDEYGLNNDFKKFVFATKKGRDQIMSQATNSANKNISQSVLENLTLKIPSKDEQKLIGYYLSTLERLITLHQRKLEKLKNIKKSMLEKMFI